MCCQTSASALHQHSKAQLFLTYRELLLQSVIQDNHVARELPLGCDLRSIRASHVHLQERCPGGPVQLHAGSPALPVLVTETILALVSVLSA